MIFSQQKEMLMGLKKVKTQAQSIFMDLAPLVLSVCSTASSAVLSALSTNRKHLKNIDALNSGSFSSLLQKMSCSMVLISHHRYDRIFLSQFAHSGVEHCATNMLGSIGYATPICSTFGPLTAVSVWLSGHIWGTIGTLFYYNYCRNMCGRKFTNPISLSQSFKLSLTKLKVLSHAKHVGERIFDYFNEHLLIYGLDFPLSAMMGFSTVLQYVNLVKACIMYRNSEISFWKLFVNILSVIVTTATMYPCIKGDFFQVYTLLFCPSSVESLLFCQKEPINRFNTSVGRVTALMYGAALCIVLLIFS